MSLNSTPIADRQVYRQDEQPSDGRDGILWVDTSASPAETKVYDKATDSWELLSEENVPGWQHITSFEDTDTTTTFDFDHTLSTTFDELQMRVDLWSYGSGNGKLAMQLNGDTSGNYDQHRIDSGSLSHYTGASEMFVAQFDASSIRNIGGSVGVSCTTRDGEKGYPKFNGNLQARPSGGTLLNGMLSVGYSSIDRIYLYSTPPGAGRVDLYGRNYR